MPDSLEKITLNSQRVLAEEGRKFSDRVKKNLDSKGITKSGKTKGSIHEEITPDTLIVWGREDFQDVEMGVTPQEAQKISFQQLKKNIYDWSMYLPLSFGSDKKRYQFAWKVSSNLIKFGSKLYRAGGRTDIYSNEIPDLITNIEERVGKIIIEHKLL